MNLIGIGIRMHLGLLLFNLFINEVVNIFKSMNCLIYADEINYSYQLTRSLI